MDNARKSGLHQGIEMGNLLDFITPYHLKARDRDYLGRMTRDKVTCMEAARQFGELFWDGDRRYGYGGYKYDGRWKNLAKKLTDYYSLSEDARILDVGCGKAHLLYELSLLLPQASIYGFDVSEYAIHNAPEPIRKNLFLQSAEEQYPFEDKRFDLVFSLNVLHNLKIFDIETALKEIERVGKNKWVAVEAYRNPRELFNLQCWALTAEAFFRPEEWTWIFERFCYKGDYEFIYFS
jgi:SAM-dependent methyltransferase